MSGAHHLDAFFDRLGVDDSESRDYIAAILKRAGIIGQLPRSPLVELKPSDIRADPATYQFRSGSDAASGVTHHLERNSWRADTQPLLVHQRLDGSYFVADGHHRLHLAQTLGAQGKGPETISAHVLREADGYSAQDVKIIAAYKNIAHGKTDPVDTARVFKEAESGEVNQSLLPKLDMSKGNLDISYHLSKLSPASFDMVEKGTVPVAMAAQVPLFTSDPTEQESVLRIIDAKLHPQKEEPAFMAKLEQERATPPTRQR